MFRCEVKYVSRGKGQSTLAAVAYRMAENLKEDFARDFDPSLAHAAYITAGRYEESGPGTIRYDYSRRVHGVKHTEICLPEGAPEWMQDAQALFSAVEAAEKRKDARTAVELVVSAPRELSSDGFLDSVRSIVNERVDRHGVAALIAVHETKASGGGVNRHAHCLLTMRAVDGGSPTSFTTYKVEGYDKRAFIQGIRHDVCQALNWQLEYEGQAARLDHRRLSVQLEEALQQRDFEKAAQVDRLPEPKMGEAAARLEAKGIESDRGKLLREVRAINAQRAAVYQHVGGLGERAKAAFIDLRRHLGDALQAFRLFSTRAKEWLHEKIGREVRHEVERQQPVRTPKDERRAEPVGQQITVEKARTIAAAVAASNLPPAERLVWQLAAEGIAREAGMRPEQTIAPEARHELERYAEGLRAADRLEVARKGAGPARERAQAQRPHDAELWRGVGGRAGASTLPGAEGGRRCPVVARRREAAAIAQAAATGGGHGHGLARGGEAEAGAGSGSG